MTNQNNNNIQNRNKFLAWLNQYKYHFISWAIFLFYEIVLVGLYTKKWAEIPQYIFHYGLNITLFYSHALLVLRYALKNPKHAIWKLPLFLLIEVIIYLAIMLFAYAVINENTGIITKAKVNTDIAFYLGGIFRALYFIVFGTGYYFLTTYNKERKKTESLEQQRLNNIIQLAKSENAFLRAQVQPHFLFNTLDFIYQHAKDRSPIAAETIVALSGMMRYAVDSDYVGDFIRLGDEIEQVENLINLHQLRQSHNLQIRFEYEDDVKELQIIPLILITLTENIFKHGFLGNLAEPAVMSIYLENNNLIIESSNLIKTEKNDLSRTGTGMENIRKRLEYTYANEATFEHYLYDNDHFKSKITIKKVDFIKDNN
jgi:two-component system LytT family sensor kinase